MSGLDFRHNMEVVRNQNGSYSAHVFADRAIKLVRQHALYNIDQVSDKITRLTKLNLVNPIIIVCKLPEAIQQHHVMERTIFY